LGKPRRWRGGGWWNFIGPKKLEIFTPKLGKEETNFFDEDFFEMGWFNHQVEIASLVIRA